MPDERAPWQACSVCGLYQVTMIQCAACHEDSCIQHAAQHMQRHVDSARLFLSAQDAAKKNATEVAS